MSVAPEAEAGSEAEVVETLRLAGHQGQADRHRLVVDGHRIVRLRETATSHVVPEVVAAGTSDAIDRPADLLCHPGHDHLQEETEETVQLAADLGHHQGKELDWCRKAATGPLNHEGEEIERG